MRIVRSLLFARCDRIDRERLVAVAAGALARTRRAEVVVAVADEVGLGFDVSCEAQVFDLVAHPAKRAYAWSYATEGAKRRFVAVLKLGAVSDAISAVRAFIANHG